MKSLRAVKGSTREDKLRNEGIKTELGMASISEKIMKYL